MGGRNVAEVKNDGARRLPTPRRRRRNLPTLLRGSRTRPASGLFSCDSVTAPCLALSPLWFLSHFVRRCCSILAPGLVRRSPRRRSGGRATVVAPALGDVGLSGFWWLTGGGWWGSIVGTVATFLMAVLVGGGLLPALLVWTLISYAWRLVGAWWLRYPLCIALLAGWFFAVAILGFDFSQTASEATLNTDVPAGATGEVARVLSCRDYYAVLELHRDADADAVKKAHRKKVLKTHPDKLGTDVVGGSEAFGRVQKAFEILSDMKKKRTYDILLHDADKKSQESAEAAAGKSGPARKEKNA